MRKEGGLTTQEEGGVTTQQVMKNKKQVTIPHKVYVFGDRSLGHVSVN